MMAVVGGPDRANGPVTSGAAATCRGCGAAFTPAPDGNPRCCPVCLARIPFPGVAWQARLPGRLHAMTGGETPAAFGCLVDAAVPVCPLMVGAREAFAARYPGHGREVGDFLRCFVATAGYLSALSAEGSMRHDLDARPVAAVNERHRARAAAWLASPWVSGNRADRELAVETLARAGRCRMSGPWCMVMVNGGPMGVLRIGVPAFLCGAGPCHRGFVPGLR